MNDLILKSPAKLNLYLRVRSRRPDGFHEIKTIFERISLADEVKFVKNTAGLIKIVCKHPQVPTGPKNLIFKAAKLLQQQYGVNSGVTVTLTKNIPVAAGLGGGSSNAATALIGLNRLWQLRLSQKQLLDLGNQLGSDIAFFLYNCPWALGEGRGERVQPIEIRKKYWHILVTPKRKMQAENVYKALDLKALTNKKDNVNILLHSLQVKTIDNIRRLLSNDLEYSIFRIAPDLKNVVGRMKTVGVKGVSFSGSGPSLFGLTESKSEAEHLCHVLKRRYRQVFAVTTC